MSLAMIFTSFPLHAAEPETQLSTAPVIETISFDGNKVIPEDELRRAISIQPSQNLNPDQVRFSIGAVESLYRDKGYWKVGVSTEIVPLGILAVRVHFDIQEGLKYQIRKIDLKGNHLISDRIILRELDIKPRDVFSQTKIYNSHRRLFLTGYFQKVNVDYSSASANLMDIHIDLEEKPTKFLKGNAGYGAQTKERFSIGYEDRNFLGNARRLEVTVTHSGFVTEPEKFRTTLLQGSLAQPYFLGTRWEGITGVSREYKERESYDSITTAWRSSLGRRFGSSVTTSLRLRYEGTRVANVIPAALDETAGFVNVTAVGPTLGIDTTDDIFLPNNGWRFSTLYEEGLRLAIGDIRFHKTQTSLAHYETWWRKLTLVNGGQMGLILPYASLTPIPIYERFTLGGANSVRGFSERDLGPKDPAGNPLGGEAFAAGTVELRWRFYKKLQALTFFDGGQLWRRNPGDIWPHIRAKSTADFRYGTGLGLRLLSPVGPVRLEFGYKVNPPPENRTFMDRFEIHFSLGEAF